MRWLWVAVGILGFILACSTRSPGVMAVGILLAFGGLFCAVFAFAAARIEARSRPDAMMISPEELMQMRKRAEAQRMAAGTASAASAGRPARPLVSESDD